MKKLPAEIIYLDPFVGKWKTTGQIKEPGKPLIKIEGTDTYEWLPGGFFLLHKVDVQIGSGKNESLEIIGFDAEMNSFSMHSFDNYGNKGVMQAKLNNDVWTFLSESMRFTGSFSRDEKTLLGIWEQSSDGITWNHWMDITLTKIL